MGAGLSASASHAGENSYDSLKVDTQNATSLHVSYNVRQFTFLLAHEDTILTFIQFPRVVLQLDPDTLQLSDECLEDVRNLKTKDDLHDFYQQYGKALSSSQCQSSEVILTYSFLLKASCFQLDWLWEAVCAAPDISPTAKSPRWMR